jgi:hypothetical protein
MYVRMYVCIYVCMCMYVRIYVCMFLGLIPHDFRSVKLSKTVEDNVVACSKVRIFTRNLSTAGNEHTLQQLAWVSSRSGSVISHQDAHTAHCRRALNTPVFQFGSQT